MTRDVWIDLSRLVWRTRKAKPSGIDRVERAYAYHFLKQRHRKAHFFIRMNSLGARELNKNSLAEFLRDIDRDWRDTGKGGGLSAIGRLIATSRRLPTGSNGITIIPSHQNWHRRSWLEQRRGKTGRLVLFLHDTIPVDYPEYARAGGAERHLERLSNGLAVADAFIVNSKSTHDSLKRHASAQLKSPLVQLAQIGIDPLSSPRHDLVPKVPYFVCLGTIEPRKNHILLLHLWRQFAERGHRQCPHLIIAGRRGWENENILDLLDRSHSLRGQISEYNDLGDADLAGLLIGSRALLMPSFAEGFGMPVHEALTLGVPVIASDLPVYRETAGDIPDYLDPLDGPGWAKAVLDYASPTSAARENQLDRMRGWTAPTWNQHFAQVHDLLERLDH